MQRLSVVTALAAVAVIGGCRQATLDTPTWFEGSFEEALVAAQSRGTMLMLDFYSPN
jgi:hypothetical protein